MNLKQSWMKATVLYLIAFIAFSLLIYWPSLLGDPFWDDWTFIFKAYRNQMDAPTPLHFFPGGSEAKSWPVFYSIVWAMLAIFKTNYFLFHMTSVLFHGFNGFLLWKTLKKLKISQSFWWALLFTAHPFHLFTVSWIIQLKTIFSMTFFLGSILFLIDFCKNKRALHLFFTLFFFILSLLTKSTTASFAAVMLLSYPFIRKQADLRKMALSIIIPMLIIASLAAVRTLWSYNFREWNKSEETKNYMLLNDSKDLVENLVMEGKSFARYTSFVFIPWNSDHLFQSRTEINFNSWEFLLLLSVSVGTIYLFLYLLKRHLYLETSGLIFYLVTILPFCGVFYIPIFAVSNFVPYWLSIPALGLIPLGSHFIKSKNILIAAVVLFSGITHWQSYQFVNTEELFIESIKKQPENELNKLALIDQYVQTYQCEKAENVYRTLIEYKDTKLYNLHIKVSTCKNARMDKK